jgi:hypothetical protein
MSLERDQTIHYILERRCASGGFCFYRLDEPNAADTYWALASLELLGAPLPADAATIPFLKGFQYPDGGFANGYIAHSVLRSLLLLGQRPDHDSSQWIHRCMSQHREFVRTVESASQFDQIFLLTDICRAMQITIPPVIKEGVVAYLHQHRNQDGGFGSPFSTLIETGQSITILAAMGCPAASIRQSLKFIKRCEHPFFGFLTVSGVQPSYLEHIHAGLLACVTLGYRPPVLNPCMNLIYRCHNRNGGYARSVYGGSSTLEYTYCALASLALITEIRDCCD